MNKKLLIAAALATTTAGGVAIAAGTLIAPRGPMAADTNGDGVISRSEYFAAAETRFKDRDANNDRKLSGDELSTGKWRARHGGKMLRQDANHDGVLTFEEATEAASAHFKAQDADQDGKLTPEEAGPRGPRGERGPGMRGQMGLGGEMGGMMLKRIDTNGDGRISRDEMRAQSDQRFDRLDTNKDGFIDKTEMDRMRGRGRRGPGGDMPPPPPEGAGE